MSREIQQFSSDCTVHWVKLYEQTRDAELVYRRLGIFRPTLRKWWQRHINSIGLKD